MITNLEERTFDLGGGQTATITFFHSNGYGHVLRDHFLSELEPWARVFHWKRKKLENLRQQAVSSDVSVRDAVEAGTYQQSVDVLADGIHFALNVPLYVKFTQERNSLKASRYHTIGYYFIGKPGFLVIVREDIVRTAMFVTGIRKSVSRVSLFREAWKYVQMRITRGEAYFDQKDQEYVRHVKSSPVSAENWLRCPV